MNHVLRLIVVFLLAALSVHMAYVLFVPNRAMDAAFARVMELLPPHRMHEPHGEILKRLVRHPLPEARYAACAFDLREQVLVVRGEPLRTPWFLAVYSPRGGVAYAISNRHVPPGEVHIRFEPISRADEEQGNIRLARVEGKMLRVPLNLRRGVLVLEALPWHPGQREILKERMKKLTCRVLGMPAPEQEQGTAKEDGGGATASRPTPRPRPAASGRP